MRSVPWLGMPTTSPAKASSASARSRAKKNCGACSGMSLPVRTCFTPHAAHQPARADAREGDAVAVVRVHIRLDLEDERGEVGLRRLHDPRIGGLGARLRPEGGQRVEQVGDADILDRAAEEGRGQMPRHETLDVEFRQSGAHQVDLLAELDHAVVGLAERRGQMVIAACAGHRCRRIRRRGLPARSRARCRAPGRSRPHRAGRRGPAPHGPSC